MAIIKITTKDSNRGNIAEECEYFMLLKRVVMGPDPELLCRLPPGLKLLSAPVFLELECLAIEVKDMFWYHTSNILEL